ncbi:zinc ribbon domain-containing protein [Alkalispirochaeta sphaeroplastigenens]|nr:C4-type zinc ribbon domain-containing protein [Alkalispirochaeta sphaeroplastigenens]
MTTIEDTIEKLKVLQDILSQKFAVQREIEELPRTLATKKELVSRLKKSFVEKNERYETSRKSVADLRVRLQEAEADREKYESQMDQITTAREYDALEKEIRDASDREQQYRKDLQREEKDLQEQKTRLEREEAMIKAEEEDLAAERAKIDSDTEERTRLLQELADQEQKTVPGLSDDLLFKFERIVRSKGGEGIVPIRNGVCNGCQMILPNQFVNDVRMGNDIQFCPYCSKIVFFSDDLDDFEEPGFSDSDEEGLSDLVDDDFDDDLFGEDDLVGYEATERRVMSHMTDDDDEDEDEEEDDLLDDDEEDSLLDDEDEALEDEDDFDEEEDEEELDD